MRLIDSGSSYMNPKEAKSSLYSRRPVFLTNFIHFKKFSILYGLGSHTFNFKKYKKSYEMFQKC